MKKKLEVKREGSIEELTKFMQDIESGAIKYEDSDNIVIHTNFDEMMAEMKTYVSSTQHKLAIKDHIAKLRIGFIDSIDESKWFVMSISALKKWQDSIEKTEPNKVILIREALKSEVGKENLLRIINGE